jgi:hypothetical protein
MTQVDDDIKFGMIEAISHLIHRDYEAIVQVRVFVFWALVLARGGVYMMPSTACSGSVLSRPSTGHVLAEAISHLIHRDYEAIVQVRVLCLGFCCFGDLRSWLCNVRGGVFLAFATLSGANRTWAV